MRKDSLTQNITISNCNGNASLVNPGRIFSHKNHPHLFQHRQCSCPFSSVTFAVGAGGSAHDLAKDLGIITGSVEATGRSNVCNREIPIGKQWQTFLDAIMQQIFNGRLMECLFEETTALAAAHETCRCDVA